MAYLIQKMYLKFSLRNLRSYIWLNHLFIRFALSKSIQSFHYKLRPIITFQDDVHQSGVSLVELNLLNILLEILKIFGHLEPLCFLKGLLLLLVLQNFQQLNLFPLKHPFQQMKSSPIYINWFLSWLQRIHYHQWKLQLNLLMNY